MTQIGIAALLAGFSAFFWALCVDQPSRQTALAFMIFFAGFSLGSISCGG